MGGVSIASWAASARQSKYRQQPEPILREGPNEVPVCGLWGLMCDAILVLGFDLSFTERLAQLIDAVGKLPTVTDHNGKPIIGKLFGGEWWHELPALGLTLREYAFEWYALGTRAFPLYAVKFVKKICQFMC